MTEEEEHMALLNGAYESNDPVAWLILADWCEEHAGPMNGHQDGADTIRRRVAREQHANN